MSKAVLCLNAIPSGFSAVYNPFEGKNIGEIYWSKQLDSFIDTVIEEYAEIAAKHQNDAIAVMGLNMCCKTPYATEVNTALVNALNASVLSVEDKPVSARYAQHIYAEKFLGAIYQDERALEMLADNGLVVYQGLNDADLQAKIDGVASKNISGAAFRQKIVAQAKANLKRIVLPEGAEPRTLKAASYIAEHDIAKCILLAETAEIEAVCKAENISLPTKNIEILSPSAIENKYLNRLVELRAAKGMTEEAARTALKDTVMLGTMMLEADEADGLVSGAVHSTADTMRPPLQIIKTAPGAKMVSSLFFMCLPDKVMVYADCAIVPEPDSAQLAEIAIQTADTAKAFGIEPKVALISYSTGNSGSGAPVEKVKAAAEKVKELRPDLAVDGPLQYDAACTPSVAKSKAPNSPVAGQANVFVFPDLNTGNTVYKAVQRNAGAIAMGPVLQGMKKPVNDLSRGALVEDIIYTIAITAVQAQ